MTTADEGITGTSTKKRDAFKRMLRACREGRIDLILVKSVSRFGRNTVDVMKTVRSLQERGIGVIFEEQGIDTRNMNSELMLAFHSAFSQSESESIRENVRWGYQRSFQNGKVSVSSQMLGFKKGDNGEIAIDEEQADTVRLIFKLYLKGMSLTDIKYELEKQGRVTGGGKTKWQQKGIQAILQNEKYKGDAILQKTYRPSLFSERTENNGVLPKYYVSDCLPRIIEPEIFDLVQEEMRKRTVKRAVSEKAKNPLQGKHSGKYALSSLLICGKCGSAYKRVTWSIHGKKKIVWRCSTRLDSGLKICSESPTLDEQKLHCAVMEAIRETFLASSLTEETALLSMERVLNSDINENETAMRLHLNELKQQKKELVRKALDDGNDGRYDLMFTNLLAEMTELIDKLEAIEQSNKARELSDARIKEIKDRLREFENQPLQYDDGLVYQIVKEIRVYPDCHIAITFADGSMAEEFI